MHIALGAKVFLTAHVVEVDPAGHPTKVVLANSGGDAVDVSKMTVSSSCTQHKPHADDHKLGDPQETTPILD